MRYGNLKEMGTVLAMLGLAACADRAPTAPRAVAPSAAPSYAAGGVAGAAYTTNNPAHDGSGTCANGPDRTTPSVNCNIYGAKQFVWINGGPTNGNSQLSAGAYFFAVLAPSGQNNDVNDYQDGNSFSISNKLTNDNLSDDYDTWQNRRFTVDGNGHITSYSADADGTTQNHLVTANNGVPGEKLIRLFPYANTPNPGGVYILAICRVGDTFPSGGVRVDPHDCKYDAFKIREFSVTKSILAIYSSDGVNAKNMVLDGTVGADGLSGSVSIPKSDAYPANTRWIHYQVLVQKNTTAPATGLTLSEDANPFCATLAGKIHCDSPIAGSENEGLNGTSLKRDWNVVFNADGIFVVNFFIDITNTGLCDQGDLDNAAVLRVSSDEQIWSNTVPLTILGACFTVKKEFVQIYTSDGVNAANMLPDGYIYPGGLQAQVSATASSSYPGNTRWVLYRLTVTKQGPGVINDLGLRENAKDIRLNGLANTGCNAASLLGKIHCDSPADGSVNPGLHGSLLDKTWPVTFTNNQFTTTFFIDITNTGLCDQGELDNIAWLTLSPSTVNVPLVQSNNAPLFIKGTCVAS